MHESAVHRWTKHPSARPNVLQDDSQGTEYNWNIIDLLLQYYSLDVVPPMTIGTEMCKINYETRNGVGKDP